MPWASTKASCSLVPMSETVLSMVQAAERLGVEVEEVFDLVLTRQLGFTQASSGRIMIPVEALTEYEQRAAVTRS